MLYLRWCRTFSFHCVRSKPEVLFLVEAGDLLKKGGYEQTTNSKKLNTVYPC